MFHVILKIKKKNDSAHEVNYNILNMTQERPLKHQLSWRLSLPIYCQLFICFIIGRVDEDYIR